MKLYRITAAALLATALTAGAAAAQDTMMMKQGETMMVTPTGETTTMKSMDPKMAEEMMKTATPMDHCVMMMMGKDGKMYMMQDTKMADGTMACDSMMKK